MGEQTQAPDQTHEKKRPKQQPPERASQGPESLGQTTVEPSAAVRMVTSGNPRVITPGAILALQRSSGNRAVGRLLASTRQQRAAVQAKLTVRPPGDQYEQEADSVGEQMMSMAAPVAGEASAQRAVEHGKQVHTAKADLEEPRQQEQSDGEKTIQRMAALAVGDKKEEDDAVIVTNLEWALKKAGGPVVDFGKNADFSGMKKDELLMIVEHGAIGGIGVKKVKNQPRQMYSAQDVVDVLTDPKKGIPDHIRGITFLSCEAGLEEQAGPQESLVQEVSKGLEDEGKKDIAVEGARGLSITHSAVGQRVVKPAKQFEYLKIQWAVVGRHPLLMASSVNLDEDTTEKYFGVREKVTVNELKKASEILVDSGTVPTKAEAEKMSPTAKAQALAPLMKDFYEELIATAEPTLFKRYAGKRLVEGAKRHVITGTD